jgi:two-component system, chemotaxis family, chemotaxis protein CheY
MPKKLLIVDDSLLIRKMIAEAATNAGWEISGEATNGKEAIDRFVQLHPDMVTLDLIMPEFDGLFALRGIMQADPKAKVLMVSALEQKSILKEAFRNGASDFIVKPLDKQLLVNTLQQLV